LRPSELSGGCLVSRKGLHFLVYLQAAIQAYLSLATSEQIFQQLFSSEYAKLCRYALTYLQDEHSAEDVVQDTFIKVWETKQELIQSPDIKYYLVTAVRNNCISALRKLKTSHVSYPEHAPEPEPEPQLTVRGRQEEEKVREKKVANALNLLPPKCKEVFLMVKMHSMSYKQVSEALDISIKTVENQMGKALKVLRESTVAAVLLLLFGSLFVNAAFGIGLLLHQSVLS
jgi:RNA polymerase sigma-70 factor (ECF subfamily)